MASSGGSDWDESERGGDSRGRRRTPSDSHSSVVSRDRMESDARFIPAPPSMRPPAPPSVTSSERSLNKTPTRQPRLPPSRSLASGEIPTRVISYADLNSASRDTVAQDREAGIGSSSQSLHSEPTDASSTSIAPRSLKRSDTKRLSSSGNMALKRLESRSSIASSQHSESRNKVRKSLAGSELRTSWDLSGDLNTSSEILKSSDTLDSRDDTGKKPSPLDRGLKSSKSVIMNNSEESLGRGAVENRSLTPQPLRGRGINSSQSSIVNSSNETPNETPNTSTDLLSSRERLPFAQSNTSRLQKTGKPLKKSMGSDSLNLGDTTPSSENLRRASSTSTDSSQTSNRPPLAQQKLQKSTYSSDLNLHSATSITNVKSEDMRRSDELRESTSHDHMNASKPPLPRSRSLARDSRSPSQTPHMSNESMDRSQVSVDRDSKSPRRSRSASLGARKPSFLSREALSSDFRRQRSLPIDDDVDRGRTRSSTALKGRSKVKLYVDTMKSGRSSPVSRRGDLPPPPKTPPPLPPTGSPRQRPRSAMGRTPSPTRSLKRAGSPQRSLKSRGLGDEQAGNQPPKIKIKVKSPTSNKVITLKGDDILPTPLRRRTSSQTPSHISHPDSDLFSHDDDLPSDNEGTGTQDEDDRKKSLIANSAPLRGIVASPNQSMGSFNMLTRSMGSGLVGVSTSSGTLVYLDEGRKEESMGTDAIAKAAEVNLAILEAGEPDLLFVDDGGKFRQKRRIVDDNKDLELNIDSKFDQKLQALCDSVNINAYHTLNALYGLHAGLCLTTLTLFPILQYTPFTSRDNLALLAFYSPVAVPISRLFSVTATGASIAAIDWAAGFGEGREVGLGVGETTMTMETRKTRRWWKVRRPWVEATMKWWKKRSGRFKRIAALISVLLALASFLSTVMMTYIDDRMFESQAGLYGGLYGQGDWFYNLTALSNTTNSTIQYDLTRWQTLNAWRGSTGVIGWGLYCLARRLNARRRRVKIIPNAPSSPPTTRKSPATSPLRPASPVHVVTTPVWQKWGEVERTKEVREEVVEEVPQRYFVPLKGNEGDEGDGRTTRQRQSSLRSNG